MDQLLETYVGPLFEYAAIAVGLFYLITKVIDMVTVWLEDSETKEFVEKWQSNRQYTMSSLMELREALAEDLPEYADLIRKVEDMIDVDGDGDVDLDDIKKLAAKMKTKHRKELKQQIESGKVAINGDNVKLKN